MPTARALCRKQAHRLVIALLLVVGVASAAVPDTLTVSCLVAARSDCAARLAAARPLPGQPVSVSGFVEAGRVPVVWLSKSLQPTTASDWPLAISRVVLADVELSPPSRSAAAADPGAPTLWPLNAFKSVGSALLLQDVRLVIRSTEVFQQHLAFFSAQPVLQSSLNTTLHTDGRTFLHITSWAGGATTLQSVTLMTGPCAALFSEALAEGGSLTTALAPAVNSTAMGSHQMAVALVSGGSRSGAGCNVYTADNQTLVPLLLDQGTLSSSEALLVLLQRNVSIAGQQETPSGRIPLGRRVVLAGFWSIPTGVDFRMTPNSLDVTAPLARVAFSSLVLENNPTGDVTTTLVAAPFSPLATVNVYAVFCSRANAAKPCTILNNVTLVLSSQTEFDYIGYMYTMFNSNAPGAKQLTLFYNQDLAFTALNFSVGPGPDSLTVWNATSVAWRMLNTIYTTRPVLAPPLPPPKLQYLDWEVSKAAPLALQVQNCADLKAALEYTTIPTRLHMLLVRNSFSLASSSSGGGGGPQQVTSILPPPTANMTVLVDGPSSLNITEWPIPVPGPTCLGPRPLVAYRTQIQGLLASQPGRQEALPIVLQTPEVHGNNSLVHRGFATLSFAHVRNGLFVPGDQRAQLTFQNLLLRDLPQGGSPEEMAAMARLPHMLPPQAWTLLMWAVNSTLSQRALSIRNSALMLPEPEYQHLAALVRLSKAFVIEVAGHEDALTFKDATGHANHLHVGVYEGPGLLAENITFLPEPDGGNSLTRAGMAYWWPAEYTPSGAAITATAQKAAPAAGTSALLPAVLVPVLVGVVAAATVAAVLLRRRHRHRKQQLHKARDGALLVLSGSQASGKPSAAAGTEAGTSAVPSSLCSSCQGTSAAASRNPGDLALDVDQLVLLQAGDACRPCSLSAGDGGDNRSSAVGPGGMQHQVLPSPHSNRQSPGFFPVIEGLPAEDAEDAEVSSTRLGTKCPASCRDGLQKVPASTSSRAQQEGHERQQQQRASSPTGYAANRAARPEAAAESAPAGLAVSTGDVASAVASGLEAWRVAVSTTTMQLAERRLAEQKASALLSGGPLTAPLASMQESGQGGELPAASSISSSCCQLTSEAAGQQQQQQRKAAAAAAAAGQQAPSVPPQQSSAGVDRPAASNPNSLVLKRVLGRGSFGQVWLAVWRGISVAVKVMHLPTAVLLDQQGHEQAPGSAPAPPHFAVMEAVLSSQCSHPNVVSVYNYMLTPLLTSLHNSDSGEPGTSSSSSGKDTQMPCTVVGEPGLGSAEVAAAAAAAAVTATAKGTATLAGWELKLILELCDEVPGASNALLAGPGFGPDPRVDHRGGDGARVKRRTCYTATSVFIALLEELCRDGFNSAALAAAFEAFHILPKESPYAAADMVLVVERKQYALLLQYRQAVQYSSSAAQQQPAQRQFTAQPYALDHNTLMLLCQGGVGVYVTSGKQLVALGVAPGASFAPARLPPDTLCTTCMKVVERMKQLVDAGQVDQVAINPEDEPINLLLAQPSLISRDTHKAGALGLYVARLQLGVLLAYRGISCHISRTEGLPFSLVFCVPDELLPQSNLLLEAMRARCAAAGKRFDPEAVQRWMGGFSQLLQDSYSSQAATPDAAAAPTAAPLLPPHLVSVLDAGEQQELLGAVAWLRDSMSYSQSAAAADAGSSPAGVVSGAASGAGSSGAAGTASSGEAGAGSSGAAGAGYGAWVAVVAQKLSLLAGLVGRLVEADARHHAISIASSSSSSRELCGWDLAADTRLLASMSAAGSGGRDYTAIATAVWGPSALSPHPKAEACRRRLGCLAQAVRLLQHARGQVDRGGPLAGIPRSGPVADVLTPNFIATLLQDSSLLRDVRLVSNPNAMGLAPALEIGGLLGHLVRVKVGVGAAITVGAGSQAGGAAITASSLNHLLSHLSAVMVVDTDTWSVCGASALQLAFAGCLGCKRNAQGVANRGTRSISISSLSAINPGLPQLLCSNRPALLSTRAQLVETLQSIEQQLLSDSDQVRQQGQQQLEELVRAEQLEEQLDQLLSWLMPSVQQRTQSMLLLQLDALVTRLLALQLSAAGLSPFAAGASAGYFAAGTYDATAWQQHNSSRVQYPAAFLSCLDNISGVGFGSKSSLVVAVLISLRKMLVQQGFTLPTAPSGRRQGGWDMQSWGPDSGVQAAMWKGKPTGKFTAKFPGSPSSSGRRGSRPSKVCIAYTDSFAAGQLARDLMVEAVLGIGNSLCPEHKGTFPVDHLQGAGAWLQQAAAADMAGAPSLFAELQSNTDLWPAQGEDGEELSAEQLAQLCSLVQEQYGLREIAATPIKRPKQI